MRVGFFQNCINIEILNNRRIDADGTALTDGRLNGRNRIKFAILAAGVIISGPDFTFFDKIGSIFVHQLGKRENVAVLGILCKVGAPAFPCDVHFLAASKQEGPLLKIGVVAANINNFQRSVRQNISKFLVECFDNVCGTFHLVADVIPLQRDRFEFLVTGSGFFGRLCVFGVLSIRCGAV